MAVCKTDDNMRAVIVVDENISDKELKKFADEGAVGCRVNLLFLSGVVSNSLVHFAHRISDYGMHLQVLADISQFDDFDALVKQCPLPVVLIIWGICRPLMAIITKPIRNSSLTSQMAVYG